MTIIDHFWLKIGRHHRMVATVCLGNVAAGASPGAAGPANTGIPSETTAGEAAATALAWLHLVRRRKVDDLPPGLFSLPPPGIFWLSVRLVKFTRSGNLPPRGRYRIRTDRCRFSERTESSSAPLGK